MTLNHSSAFHELRRLDSDEYRNGLRIQRDRLSLSTWIRNLVQSIRGGPQVVGRPHESILCQALEGIGRLRSIQASRSRRKETLRQREPSTPCSSELALCGRRFAPGGQSDEARKVTTRGEYRFLGRLEALRLRRADTLRAEPRDCGTAGGGQGCCWCPSMVDRAG